MQRITGTRTRPPRQGSAATIRVGWTFSVLAGVVVAAVAYGELIPFQFVPAPAGGGLAGALAQLSWSASPVEDILTNVLVYVPVGLLLTLHFGRGARRWGPAMLGGFLFASCMGVCLELAQLHLPMRVASATDVLNNCLGGLAGVLCAPLVHRRWQRVRRRVALCLAMFPHHAVYVGLAVAICWAALAPFDLAPTWSRVQSGAASALWWPVRGSCGQLVEAMGGDANRALLACLRQLGVFAALAFMGVRSLREAGQGPVVAALVAFRRAAVLAVVLECAQVLSRSHTFELLDMLLGWIGALLGIWLVFLVDGTGWGRDGERRVVFNHRLPVMLGLLGCLAYQGAGAWLADGDVEGPATTSIGWLPFAGEFMRPMALAATAMAERFLGFAITAMLLFAVFAWERGRVRQLSVPAMMLLWACALEVGRWNLGAGSADTSGPVLALAAATLAAGGVAWARRLAGSAWRELAAAGPTAPLRGGG
jgi:glycopeptide antibiotics resistance protein